MPNDTETSEQYKPHLKCTIWSMGEGLGGPFIVTGSSQNSPFVGGAANHSAISSYESWSNLENILGVTLPRDPLNQQGGLPNQAGKYFNYVYHSRQGGNTSPAYCPQREHYVLVYRLESRERTGTTEGCIARCGTETIPAGTLVCPANGAFAVGVTPAM